MIRQQTLPDIGNYLLLLMLFVAAPEAGLAKEVVGWVEKARIFPGDMLVKARVDTGAKTSSLGAEILDYFERNNEAWVRFSTTSYKGKTLLLERKVLRTVKVKRSYRELTERPVIKMGVCLGSIYHEAEVSLEDRSHMNYQMLIGREFLNGHFLVDPEAVFTNPPHCEKVMTMDGQG